MRTCLLLCLLSMPAVAQVTKSTVTLSFPNCSGSTPS